MVRLEIDSSLVVSTRGTCEIVQEEAGEITIEVSARKETKPDPPFGFR
jgi:hypothetical protein